LNRIRLMLSDPPWILVLVWSATLFIFRFGPLRYSDSPTLLAVAVVGSGLLVVFTGSVVGKRIPSIGLPKKLDRDRVTTLIIAATSILGIAGIGAIALDRLVLAGTDGGMLATLLRCAPSLVDDIKIPRTPILYLGYLTFSFAYVSIALFWVEAESCRRWSAWLAQLAIVSPIVYSFIYAGRMPILLVVSLLVGASLSRMLKGKSLIPRGHLLIPKLAVLVCALAVYSVVVGEGRQGSCTAMSGLMSDLSDHGTIETSDLNEFAKKLADAKSIASEAITAPSSNEMTNIEKFKATDIQMSRDWSAKPAWFVQTAVDAGLPARLARILLTGTFYFNHGTMTLDRIIAHQREFSPYLGFYQVGILSPIERVFFPGANTVARMDKEISSSGILGFYPSIWGAAFLDFGMVGSIAYLFLFGVAAGWAWRGTKTTGGVLASMLLSFSVSAALLSPVNAPLGVSNSALVLGSILAAGLVHDIIYAVVLKRTNS
jgi:hypothetical protein